MRMFAHVWNSRNGHVAPTEVTLYGLALQIGGMVFQTIAQSYRTTSGA